MSQNPNGMGDVPRMFRDVVLVVFLGTKEVMGIMGNEKMSRMIFW